MQRYGRTYAARPVRRTQHDLIGQIEDLFDEKMRHDVEIERLDKQVQKQLEVFKDQPRDELWIETLRYIFYAMPDISYVRLAKAIFGTKGGVTREMRAIIGLAVTDKKCDHCEEPVIVDFGNQFVKMANKASSSDSNIYCQICLDEANDEVFRERQEMWARRERQVANHRETLKSLPYHDYRQTAAFKNIRQFHLSSRGYYGSEDRPQCLLCRDENGLDVYHRSRGDVRANLDYSDLLVLCTGCYDKLCHVASVLPLDIDR